MNIESFKKVFSYEICKEAADDGECDDPDSCFIPHKLIGGTILATQIMGYIPIIGTIIGIARIIFAKAVFHEPGADMNAWIARGVAEIFSFVGTGVVLLIFDIVNTIFPNK